MMMACSTLQKAFFLKRVLPQIGNSFSTTACTGIQASDSRYAQRDRYKLLIVGGGAGGCSVAAKFARKLNLNEMAIIEPAETHYYQPMWTLVGAGLKRLEDTARPMGPLFPVYVEWVKDKIIRFEPKSQKVICSNGREMKYDYLVVAMGIQLHFDHVKGLVDALQTSPNVCSNYSPLYVNKTFEAMKNFQKGNAVFTFPNTPVKCAGAPQKIMYLTEDYLRKHNKKKDANIIYCTSLGVLFGVKWYADALWQVIKRRGGIEVNLRHNLIEVIPKEKKAIFENLDKPGTTKTINYEMLHVTPPMGPYEALKTAPDGFVDAAGFLDLNSETLQHKKYPNVFGIGDCTNLPTSKTAAAVAAQSRVLEKNLWAVMKGRQFKAGYDGYTSCPIVTTDHTCILAEFDYAGNPLETFPFDQRKERRSMFYMKKYAMPWIYWKMMLKGRWNGPEPFRKMFNVLRVFPKKYK